MRTMVGERAGMLGVSGYVQNDRDGSVRIVVKGKEDKIETLREWLKTDPGSAHVASMNEESSSEKLLEEDFKIRNTYY